MIDYDCDWVNPNDSDPTVLRGVDIIKTVKKGKERNTDKKSKKSWSLSVYKTEITQGADRIKNYFIGIKIPFWWEK